MSPTIRVDDEVYAALQSRARAFVDTPNDVMRDLLGLPRSSQAPPTGLASGVAKGPHGERSPKGRDTTQAAYRTPILHALAELGGIGTVREILSMIEQDMHDEFTPGDHEPTPSGAIRWQVTAKFELSKMVRDGILNRVSWGKYQLA